jgi:hypothetical protein
MYRMAVRRQQQIAGLDSSALARAIIRDALRLQTSRRFYPPDAIGRRLVAVLLHQVETGADDRRSREESQQNGHDAGLKGPLHDEPQCSGKRTPLGGLNKFVLNFR